RRHASTRAGRSPPAPLAAPRSVDPRAPRAARPGRQVPARSASEPGPPGPGARQASGRLLGGLGLPGGGLLVVEQDDLVLELGLEARAHRAVLVRREVDEPLGLLARQ